MSNYDSYFLMKADDAVEYAKEKVPQIEWDAERKLEMETLITYLK